MRSNLTPVRDPVKNAAYRSHSDSSDNTPDLYWMFALGDQASSNHDWEPVEPILTFNNLPHPGFCALDGCVHRRRRRGHGLGRPPLRTERGPVTDRPPHRARNRI